MPCSARYFRGEGDWLRVRSLLSRDGWIKHPRGILGYCSPRASLSDETLRRLILILKGRLRWWSFGAFGNKGRLEGSQYLAGRRAPPLLFQ
jgi:hypothetical protein